MKEDMLVKLLFSCLTVVVVSVICFFIKNRVGVLLITIKLIEQNALVPLKIQVTYVFNVLINLLQEVFKNVKPITMPLVLLFIGGLGFIFVDYYLLSISAQFIAPPVKIVGLPLNLNYLLAILWIFGEIVLTAILFETYFPLNLLPEKFIEFVKTNKWVKRTFICFIIFFLVSGSILAFIRADYIKKTASISENRIETFHSYDTNNSNELSDNVSKHFSDGGLFVNIDTTLTGVIASLVTLIFPIISSLCISLGLKQFWEFLKICLVIIAIAILGTVIIILIVLPYLLIGVAYLTIFGIHVIAAPITKIFGKDNEDKDKGIFNIILFIIFFFLTSCTMTQQQPTVTPKNIYVLVDLSGSFRKNLKQSVSDIKTKIISNLNEGDKIKVLSITDDSFNEDKSIICSAEIPIMGYLANKSAFINIQNTKIMLIDKIDSILKQKPYNRTDVFGSISYAAYLLSNTEDNCNKILIAYTDLEDNIHNNTSDLHSLKNISKVMILYVSHGKNAKQFEKKCVYWEGVYNKSGIKDVKILDHVLSRDIKILE